LVSLRLAGKHPTCVLLGTQLTEKNAIRDTQYVSNAIFDKKVDYASREEMAMQNRISDEDYRDRGVPFSCCNLRAMAPCMHTEMTNDKTINMNGCVEAISPILLRIVLVAYFMTGTLIVIQVLLCFLVTRVRYLA